MSITKELPEGLTLFHFKTLDSTNKTAVEMARTNASSGTVVWAESQKNGKGRNNRTWISEFGNLYSSIILRPQLSIEHISQLTFIAPLAIGDLIEHIDSNIDYSFKWPNDVLVAGRKICGILLQSGSWEKTHDKWIVLGCGLNLASFPLDTETPATSLFEETGRSFVSEEVLISYYTFFSKWYDIWLKNGFLSIRKAWLDRSHPVGQPLVTQITSDKKICGQFLGIDENGALLIVTKKGEVKINAGEVFIDRG